MTRRQSTRRKVIITKQDLARARKSVGKDKFRVTDRRQPKFIQEEIRIQKANKKHGDWRRAMREWESKPLPKS